MAKQNASWQTLRSVSKLQLSFRAKSWKQELYKFLRQYRATPHTTMNVSPSEALNGRKLKTTCQKYH